MAGALAGGLSKPGPEWGRGPFFSAGVWGSPGGASGRAPPARAGGAGDMGSVPGSGRSPGGGYRNPLQYSCLENPHIQNSLVGYSP